MLLLSLKNGWQPLLFESKDSGEVWKLFCGLQNKLPKALLFNEVNHERFELSHCFTFFPPVLAKLHHPLRGKGSRSKMGRGVVKPTLHWKIVKFFLLIPNLGFSLMFNFSFWETFVTDLMKIGCSYDVYGQKQILPFFRFFLSFLRIWRHSDVTRKLMVLILIDMDRGDPDQNIGTKKAS